MAHGLTWASPRHKGDDPGMQGMQNVYRPGPDGVAMSVGHKHSGARPHARLALPWSGITAREWCRRLHRAVRNSACRSYRYWLH